jgi:hypothetical protein
MKISIDTKEDSPAEIKKLIRMLSSLIDEEVMANQGDIFSSGNISSGNKAGALAANSDVFNIFSDSSEKTENKETKAESDEIDLDNIPEIQEYR